MGEMVYARYLLNGDPVERARLRRAANEDVFGVQIATNDVGEGVAAMRLAREAGADFVDLNCGCPIHEATRRGLGSALLRNPKRCEAEPSDGDTLPVHSTDKTFPPSTHRLGELVRGLVDGGVDIPLTVKVRLGTSNRDINVLEVAEEMVGAGAAGLTVHGRSAQERYSSAANWAMIKEVVERVDSRIPVVGNGDVLTFDGGIRRIETAGVDSVMVGRGALETPWVFDEGGWEPDTMERVEVYRRLACYMKEHFGDDGRGRKMASYFFPWHFEFFCRHSPGKESMQSRLSDMDTNPPPLESLLACRDQRAHKRIAGILWDSRDDGDAVTKLTELAESAVMGEIRRGVKEEDGEGGVEELSNIPGEDKRARKRRAPKPKRTEMEVEKIRAERKAKREAAGITDFKHVSGKRRGS